MGSRLDDLVAAVRQITTNSGFDGHLTVVPKKRSVVVVVHLRAQRGRMSLNAVKAAMDGLGLPPEQFRFRRGEIRARVVLPAE